jgi:MacB-like periplasmic core domain
MTEWLEALRQDVRYALRGLRKAPVFSAVATLTLAIGIGANTTIFSAIDALLLRPVPYPDQDRLVRVSLRDPKYPQYGAPVSWTDVAHWQAANDVFEQIEGVSGPDIVAMSAGGFGERASVQHSKEDVSFGGGHVRGRTELRILATAFRKQSEGSRPDHILRTLIPDRSLLLWTLALIFSELTLATRIGAWRGRANFSTDVLVVICIIAPVRR